MKGLIIRIVIAVISVAILFALLTPVLHIFRINSNDLETILQICIGALGLLYIAFGPTPPTWTPRA